jgi:hypothetical protein
MPLIVYTAKITPDLTSPDKLSVSRSENKELVKSGQVGGHRGIGDYLAPSAKLQARRYQRCRFQIENETEEDWLCFQDDYVKELRKSYREHRLAWEMLLGWERVIIGCNGERVDRAPRVVLASLVLLKLRVTYLGELG